MDDDSDDDPVVQEVPNPVQLNVHSPFLRQFSVFLSSEALKEQLYLAQSPNRPKGSNEASAGAELCCTQSLELWCTQSLLELETIESANQTNYDTMSATAPMRGCDGAVEADRDQDESAIRRTLQSKLVPSHQRLQFAPPNYAIGAVREGMHGKELHLTPIHEVISLRPSFTHHKAKDDPAAKPAAKGAKAEDDTKKGIQQITTKIKKKESDRQMEWRVNSLDEVRRQEKQEQWLDLEWFPQGAPETIELMHKLHYGGNWNEVSFEVEKQKYIEFMIKGGVQLSEDERRVQAAAAQEVKSADHWIKQLVLCIGGGSEDWLRRLGRTRSHIQYDGELQKQDARDAVLMAFADKRQFTRGELHAVTKQLQPLALKDVLSTVAVRRGDQLWEFKLKDDDSFTATLYTEELKSKHQLYWRERKTALEQIANDQQGNEANKGAYLVLQEWLIKTLDFETMFNLDELLLLREQQQADDPAFDSAVQDISDRDFRQILDKVAVNIRGVFVPRTAPPSLCKPNDDKAKYWPVLVEMFGEMETARRDDAKKKVKVLLGESDVPPAAWNKFMKRLATNLRANWTFKGKP